MLTDFVSSALPNAARLAETYDRQRYDIVSRRIELWPHRSVAIAPTSAHR
jgi:hypothetical protein